MFVTNRSPKTTKDNVLVYFYGCLKFIDSVLYPTAGSYKHNHIDEKQSKIIAGYYMESIDTILH